MLELILAVAMIVAVYKIAEADEQSGWTWCGLAILLTIAGIALVPWPIIRAFLASVAALVAMFVYKVVRNK